MIESCLRDTKVYTVDVFETTDIEDIRARVSILTFVFKNGIFFVMPRLYPERFASVKSAREGSPPRHQPEVGLLTEPGLGRLLGLTQKRHRYLVDRRETKYSEEIQHVLLAVLPPGIVLHRLCASIERSSQPQGGEDVCQI